jgi:hypothetical protein
MIVLDTDVLIEILDASEVLNSLTRIAVRYGKAALVQVA